VAHASHNEPLIGFMTAISEVIHSATAIEPFDTDEIRHQTIAAHARIQAAIVAGDAGPQSAGWRVTSALWRRARGAVPGRLS